MHNEPPAAQLDPPEADVPALDRYTSYEDGDSVVICDRKNPNAWIRVDSTTDVPL